MNWAVFDLRYIAERQPPFTSFTSYTFLAVAESQQACSSATISNTAVKATSRSTAYRKRKREAEEATAPFTRKPYSCSLCGGKLAIVQ